MLAIKNAEESEPVNHNAIAQCKILLAEHMYEATMLWEIFLSQNPGTEQLNIRNLILRKVYLNGVLSLLDEVIIAYRSELMLMQLMSTISITKVI